MTTDDSAFFGQRHYAVRLDWGPTGALTCAADANLVVDVLSFSTAVTVAVERGSTVYPCRWKGARAAELAQQHDAVLAVGRLEALGLSDPPPSLSPAGLLTGAPVPRLVLPSPNGSTIVTELSEAGAKVAIGCLRNAEAAARWAHACLTKGHTVSLTAAGERWESDGSLRPALEDQLGAGAIVSALLRLRGGESGRGFSPESLVAARAFEASAAQLEQLLRDSVGGRELAERSFEADVEVAAELNASHVVPVLIDGAFAPAAGGGGS